MLISVDSNGTLVVDPFVLQTKLASSIHVLAFSSDRDLLVVESEGDFTIDLWDEVYQRARLTCHGEEGSENENEDVTMRSDAVSKLDAVLKDAVEKKVAKEQRWKKNME